MILEHDYMLREIITTNSKFLSNAVLVIMKKKCFPLYDREKPSTTVRQKRPHMAPSPSSLLPPFDSSTSAYELDDRDIIYDDFPIEVRREKDAPRIKTPRGKSVPAV